MHSTVPTFCQSETTLHWTILYTPFMSWFFWWCTTLHPPLPWGNPGQSHLKGPLPTHNTYNVLRTQLCPRPSLSLAPGQLTPWPTPLSASLLIQIPMLRRCSFTLLCPVAVKYCVVGEKERLPFKADQATNWLSLPEGLKGSRMETEEEPWGLETKHYWLYSFRHFTFLN